MSYPNYKRLKGEEAEEVKQFFLTKRAEGWNIKQTLEAARNRWELPAGTAMKKRFKEWGISTKTKPKPSASDLHDLVVEKKDKSHGSLDMNRSNTNWNVNIIISNSLSMP
jgi:hypothetical protein